MKKSTKIAIIVSGVAALSILSAAVFIGCRYYFDKKAPNFRSEYILYVYPDMSADAALDSLAEGAGAVRKGSLRRVAESENLLQKMKPGKYSVKPGHSAAYAVRMLINGWQTPQNLTLSGTIRSKDRLADVISRQMMVDSTTVANSLNDSVFLSKYGFTPENVFALFLPDTYQMYWTSSVESIFDRFYKEYNAFWTEDRLAKTENLKLDRMQVSVLASIVSGETLCAAEYPTIAGVYLNRYRKGMKLQADPTVCFCYGYTLDRVLKKHLTIDSPYNTYKYAGLPPAPINVPPKACIDAVLNPDRHGYIYFCASDAFDGTHNFAVTYSEHLKNARAFQRALTARRKAAAQK